MSERVHETQMWQKVQKISRNVFGIWRIWGAMLRQAEFFCVWAHSHDSLAKLIMLSALAKRHIALSPSWKLVCQCNGGWLTSEGKDTRTSLFLDLEIVNKPDTHTYTHTGLRLPISTGTSPSLTSCHGLPSSLLTASVWKPSVRNRFLMSHHFCWIRFRD